MRNQLNGIASALALLRSGKARSDAEMDYATAVIWRYTGHYSGRDGWEREPLVRIPYAQLSDAEKVRKRTGVSGGPSGTRRHQGSLTWQAAVSEQQRLPCDTVCAPTTAQGAEMTSTPTRVMMILALALLAERRSHDGAIEGSLRRKLAAQRRQSTYSPVQPPRARSAPTRRLVKDTKCP